MVPEADGSTPTTAPAPSGTTAPSTNGHGFDAADWRMALPEDLRADKSLAQIPDLPTLAKGYVEAQRTIVSKGLTPPKDDAPQEVWDAFYARLGRPESPDKYDFGIPEQLPEGVTINQEDIKGFQALAHSLGLTPKQAKAIADFDLKRAMGRVNGETRAQAEARAKGEAELVKAWGPKDGPVYQGNLHAARELAAKAFGGDPDILAALDDHGNNPALLKGMAKLADMARGHGLVRGEPVYASSPEEAKARIAEIRNDPKHPFNDHTHRDHQAAQEEMQQLYRRAYGTQPAGTREPMRAPLG